MRHSTLAQKLSNLDLPDNIFNWLVAFLQDRSHATRFKGQLSAEAFINASVMPGSSVGPSAFIVGASNLHPIHDENKIVKYADDTYLIVGASMRRRFERTSRTRNRRIGVSNNWRCSTGHSRLLAAPNTEQSALNG